MRRGLLGALVVLFSVTAVMAVPASAARPSGDAAPAERRVLPVQTAPDGTRVDSLPFQFTFDFDCCLESRMFTIPANRNFKLTLDPTSVNTHNFTVTLYRRGCFANSCHYDKGTKTYTANGTVQTKIWDLGSHTSGTYDFHMENPSGHAGVRGSGTAALGAN